MRLHLLIARSQLLSCLCPNLKGCKHELHLTKIGDSVTQNERGIVLKIDFDGGTQVSTLSEEEEMLELEDPLDNLIRGRGLYMHQTVLTDNGLLVGEVT